MNSSALHHGACPAPFYDAALFPTEGGYIGGRLCSPQSDGSNSPRCCLPCPTTDWTSDDSFATYNTVAAWLNVAGFILLSFLLTSYLILPVQKTRSHYLSISLIVAILFISLGFIVPLGANPDICYNDITPNDMHSSMTCAWSGAFIVAGGLSGAVWIFIRALSMHLQICWNIVPARRFFFVSQVLGWGIPAALFAATITVTGVSFRFGTSCHVNHEHSMQTFWGWLLVVSAASLILQLGTFGYCTHVFISNLWSEDQPPSQISARTNGLPHYTTGSVRTQTAKAIWRRLKSVLFLQWRGILIVTVCLVDVIFFAVTFVYFDDLESSIVKDRTRAEPWIICLVMSGGDKNKCLHLAEKLFVKVNIVGAVLIMLSLIGIEVFCFLFRWSILAAWKDMFAEKFSRKQEFVSLDARAPHERPDSSAAQRCGANGVAFEMQRPKEYSYDMDAKTMEPIISTASPTDSIVAQSPPHFGPNTPEPGFSDYFRNSRSKSQLSLQLPKMPDSLPKRSTSNSTTSHRDSSLFSSRVPSHGNAQSLGWDPTSTYAAGSMASPVRPTRLPREDGFAPGQAL